jgi:hypothetical protein
VPQRGSPWRLIQVTARRPGLQAREETPLYLPWNVGAAWYVLAAWNSQAGTSTTSTKPRQDMPWLRGEASGIPGLRTANRQRDHRSWLESPRFRAVEDVKIG